MRRLAFIVAVLGMFFLAIEMSVGLTEIESYGELEGLEINQRVSVVGKVADEKMIYEGVKVLYLDSGIELVCECLESFEGKNISVVGVVEEYNPGNKRLPGPENQNSTKKFSLGRKQVRVLEIVAGNFR